MGVTAKIKFGQARGQDAWPTTWRPIFPHFHSSDGRKMVPMPDFLSPTDRDLFFSLIRKQRSLHIFCCILVSVRSKNTERNQVDGKWHEARCSRNYFCPLEPLSISLYASLFLGGTLIISPNKGVGFLEVEKEESDCPVNRPATAAWICINWKR